jgi:hypothetical protein
VSGAELLISIVNPVEILNQEVVSEWRVSHQCPDLVECDRVDDAPARCLALALLGVARGRNGNSRFAHYF